MLPQDSLRALRAYVTWATFSSCREEALSLRTFLFEAQISEKMSENVIVGRMAGKGRGMKTNVKNWYCEEYDFDELGSQINPDLTLEDLYECLRSGESVYDLLGVGDSIVRERAFAKLASVLGVGYKVIYDLWLSSNWNEFSGQRPD